MIKLENEKLSELIIVWYNGRHSQLNLCIEVNVYSYIALNTGAHCSIWKQIEHPHLSAILSIVYSSSWYTGIEGHCMHEKLNTQHFLNYLKHWHF